MSYLTGPVNNLTDYQVEFNGLLMGPGTPYDIQPGQSFLDMAAVKSMDQPRVWADGSWSGPDFADVLLPVMPVGIGSGPGVTFAQAVATFIQTFALAVAGAGLWVKLPSMGVVGVLAKTNKRSLPQDMWAGGYSLASVQWRCPDPAWQSVPRTLPLAANGAAQSGLVFPMFAPASGTYTPPNAGADFGSTAVAGSSGTLTNAGNSPAWPYVVVSAAAVAVTNFTITIDGNQVTWADTIPAFQSLVVDYSTGLATLTGGVDRTYSLTSRAFSAVPAGGTSTAFFTASSGTATITVADVSR